MGIQEDRLYALLKEGEAPETNEDASTSGENQLYPEPSDRDEEWTGKDDPAEFSSAAKAGDKETRHGVLGRVLGNKDRASENAKSLMRSSLKSVASGNYESTAPLLQKVSYPRQQTLSEKVIKAAGRL